MLKNIKNLWRAVFHGREDRKAFQNSRLEFAKLKNQLGELRRTQTTEPIETLVKYFDLTSRCHDHGIDDLLQRLQYRQNASELLEALANFQGAINNRQPYGWNRTRPGQVVTADDVYLGNIWGICTKTAAAFIAARNAPKGGWGHSKSVRDWNAVNPYDVVVEEQVAPYLQRRLGPLMLLCEQIAYELSRV